MGNSGHLLHDRCTTGRIATRTIVRESKVKPADFTGRGRRPTPPPDLRTFEASDSGARVSTFGRRRCVPCSAAPTDREAGAVPGLSTRVGCVISGQRGDDRPYRSSRNRGQSVGGGVVMMYGWNNGWGVGRLVGDGFHDGGVLGPDRGLGSFSRCAPPATAMRVRHHAMPVRRMTLRVLDTRFARGEIDAEEYTSRRDLLRSG